MKTTVYEEFIQFDKNFTKNKNEFYGVDSPLDECAQKVFLEKYVQYAKKRYGEDICFRKAVEKAEVDCAEKALRMDKGEKFHVYKRNKKRLYKQWALYTARAVVKDDYLELKDSYAFPLPAGKYEFEKGVKEFTFAVYIDKSYYAEHKWVGATTTSRFIEFRQNCKEVIKLCFAPNGTFAHKDGSVKPYHYTVTELGKYEFNAWNIVRIVFHKDNFTLEFNGNTFTLHYSNQVQPDNVYVGGGMQPADFWRFKPISLTTKDGDISDFFALDISDEQKEEYVGEQYMPIVLGTKENQDKELILRKSFVCDISNRYELDVRALDPSGMVYINGKKVMETDDFQPFTIDITPYVQSGQNNLEIVVSPRAPETLYPWHRHNDYYNGWFCLGAEVKESKKFGLKNLVVRTLEVGDKSKFNIRARVENEELFGKKYALFLTKVYPCAGESFLLKEGIIGDSIDENFEEKVDLWNVDAPNLYSVKIEVYENGKVCHGLETECGFRTVEQKQGAIFINGEKTVLKGALNMQFLPPYDEIPLNHVCPSDKQIVEQALAIKALNGNCMRLHQLGYGCGDKRFARICDRLGILLIWTTRLIDSVENVKWTDEWKQSKGYQIQMLEVINSPSIIMWESSNEFHGSLEKIDLIYNSFIATVKEIDTTRLICPVSHLYYGGGLYGGAHYYSDGGKFDEDANVVQSSWGWTDKDVVRSAHTYCLLLGYGEPWKRMVAQDWKWQNELFNNQEKAYLVSEYAIIGRQNPETEEAKNFINKDSYEFNDEKNALGFIFADNEWEISQAYQAMCASVATKQLLKKDTDGMLWCCLWGGANNASYLKPIIDFYGYTKLAFYSLKEAFQKMVAFNENPDVLLYRDYEIAPVVCGLEDKKEYVITVSVLLETGEKIDERMYRVFGEKGKRTLSPFTPKFQGNGYYIIRYEIKEGGFCDENRNA